MDSIDDGNRIIAGRAFNSGCMICGNELFCTPDKALMAKCYYCGKEEITNVFCMEGHYVCDDCHRESILQDVKIICMEDNSSNPVALMLKVFSLPNLKINGPEYHSIVPAVLVAAYMNWTRQKKEELIDDAIRRGKQSVGGMCGTHGACGACIGVGIAYSIIHKTTPYSIKERGRANHITGLALEAISKFGGPRCCKRESMTAILVAVKHFGCFPRPGKEKYICRQFRLNQMCIGSECPYFPQ